MSTETDTLRLQRRKDDLLAAAVSAKRQLDNVANALKALHPDELRALGMPTVNYHDLLDAGSRLATARKSLTDIQEIAEKHGAI